MNDEGLAPEGPAVDLMRRSEKELEEAGAVTRFSTQVAAMFAGFDVATRNDLAFSSVPL